MVVEHAFHDRLAVIERTFDRHGVNVLLPRCSHHAPLHIRNPAARKEHEQVRARATAKRLDRGAAGVPRRRDHDRGALSTRCEHVVHEPAQELHRQILERKRRSMKQLEDEIAHAELRERRHRGVAETAVGVVCQAGEVVLRDGAAHEGTDDVGGNFRIGAAGKACDGLRIELWPSCRNVEAAVAGKSCQRDLDEVERGGLTPGGDIAQGPGAPNEATRRLCRALFHPTDRPHNRLNSLTFPSGNVEQQRPRT
jgi:hypothetical protein